MSSMPVGVPLQPVSEKEVLDASSQDKGKESEHLSANITPKHEERKRNSKFDYVKGLKGGFLCSYCGLETGNASNDELLNKRILRDHVGKVCLKRDLTRYPPRKSRKGMTAGVKKEESTSQQQKYKPPKWTVKKAQKRRGKDVYKFAVDTVYAEEYIDDWNKGVDHFVTEILENKLNLHKKAGLCKVIPPENWSPHTPKHMTKTDEITLYNPKSQHVIWRKGKDDIFHLENNDYPGMTVGEYIELTSRLIPQPNEEDDMEEHMWDMERLLSQCPIYGTDVTMESSMFGDKEKCSTFNIGHMESLLDIARIQKQGEYMDKTGKKKVKDISQCRHILGITKSYVYYGSYGSVFPLHIENVDSYSINYHHSGAPKIWYTNRPKHFAKWTAALSKDLPKEFHECGVYYRHKNILVGPPYFRRRQLDYGELVQNVNEFVIAFPKGFHVGYNTGYNCNEAVNFGTRRWVGIAERAENCLEGCEYKDADLCFDMKLFKDHWDQKLFGAYPKCEEGDSGDEESENLDPTWKEPVNSTTTTTTRKRKESKAGGNERVVKKGPNAATAATSTKEKIKTSEEERVVKKGAVAATATSTKKKIKTGEKKRVVNKRKRSPDE